VTPERASDSRGVTLIGRGGRIEYASPAAARLFREYFGAQASAELPLALADWVDSGAARSSWHHNDRRLTIDRVGDALVLEETRDPVGLTEREREVLALVAEGRTNLEVAEALWIAPSTVRKHLEHARRRALPRRPRRAEAGRRLTGAGARQAACARASLRLNRSIRLPLTAVRFTPV
jgi:DNA-binding NarL/FixJ family response regulator